MEKCNCIDCLKTVNKKVSKKFKNIDSGKDEYICLICWESKMERGKWHSKSVMAFNMGL